MQAKTAKDRLKMGGGLFRKKNLEKAASPENLDTFLRVTNPSSWVGFAAIIVLLVGALSWAIFGTIESTAKGVVVSDGAETTCYVSENVVTKVKAGMTVRLEDDYLTVTNIASQAVYGDNAIGDYAMQLGGFQSGEYLYALSVDHALPTGNYACEVVLEVISPVDLLS